MSGPHCDLKDMQARALYRASGKEAELVQLVTDSKIRTIQSTREADLVWMAKRMEEHDRYMATLMLQKWSDASLPFKLRTDVAVLHVHSRVLADAIADRMRAAGYGARVEHDTDFHAVYKILATDPAETEHNKSATTMTAAGSEKSAKIAQAKQMVVDGIARIRSAAELHVADFEASTAEIIAHMEATEDNMDTKPDKS